MYYKPNCHFKKSLLDVSKPSFRFELLHRTILRRMNLERSRNMKPIYHSPELCTLYSNQFICEVIQWHPLYARYWTSHWEEEEMQMWVIQGLCISERDRLRHKSHWFKADSNQLFSWSLRLFVFEVIHLGLLFPAFCYKHNVLSFESLVGMFQWVCSEKTSGVETLSLSYLLTVRWLTVAARAMSMATFYLFLFLKIYFNSF